MFLSKNIRCVGSVVFFLLLIRPTAFSQTTYYTQSWTNFQFTRSFSEKWNAELYGRVVSSSTTDNTNPFELFSYFLIRGWGHYYSGQRWKFSLAFSYYDYSDFPELNQNHGFEYRISIQALYYIFKNRYTLNARSRLEDRLISDVDYKPIYRFREQIKYLQPLNKKSLEAGTFYCALSEEVFIRLNDNAAFDKNRITLGFGFVFTKVFQMELAYQYEYFVRKPETILQHEILLTFAFKNLYASLKNKNDKTDNEND